MVIKIGIVVKLNLGRAVFFDFGKICFDNRVELRRAFQRVRNRERGVVRAFLLGVRNAVREGGKRHKEHRSAYDDNNRHSHKYHKHRAAAFFIVPLVKPFYIF